MGPSPADRPRGAELLAALSLASELAPDSDQVLSDAELDSLLEAMGDFVDLQSPWTVGHSRVVVELATKAGEDGDIDTLRMRGDDRPATQELTISQELNRIRALDPQEVVMPYIESVTGESATGLLADLFAADRKSWGYLPNLATTFGIRPEVYQAWRQLNGAIKSNMDPRRYELVTVAAAVALRSSYCALAHGRVLAQGLMSEEEVIDVVADPESAELAPVDRAVISLARKIVRGAADVNEQDIGALRDCGLSDEEIFDVVLATAARCFFSKTLDATGTGPDAALAQLSPKLRDALTVGRPIEPAGQE